MAIGMCRACDEFADESEFDWDLELCLNCAADREEEEEECTCAGWGCRKCCSTDEEIRQRQGTFS